MKDTAIAGVDYVGISFGEFSARLSEKRTVQNFRVPTDSSALSVAKLCSRLAGSSGSRCRR